MPTDEERKVATGLRNRLQNAARLDRQDVVQEVIAEMTERGIARSKDYAFLEWNQDSVRDALARFVDVTRTEKGNRRTTYTQPGGKKIGRSKRDPDWSWIDTYTAIKIGNLNAVFVCYVARPGDMPIFELRFDESTAETYNADSLEKALSRWKEVAEQARQISNQT